MDEGMEVYNTYAAQLALNFNNPVKVKMLTGKIYDVRRIHTGYPASLSEGEIYVMYSNENGYAIDCFGPEENFVFLKG